MKDQLLLLLELQSIDIRAQEVRQSMEALPARLAPAKQDLAKLESLLEMQKQQLSEAESWLNEQGDLVNREEDAAKYAKVKLQSARNAKDFAMANREIDNKRRNITDRESEMKKVNEKISTTRGNIETQETDIAKLREHIVSEEGDAVETVKKLETELVEIEGGRDALESKLPKQLLKRYKTIVKRKGIGVVPVTEGICQGCHMAVPPQLNNILARYESIEQCANCHRLLYRSELVDELAASKEASQ